VTESRKNTLRLLDDHFAIRESKINHKITAGISSFLLEGPSGIGKSEMAIEYLHAQNYQNGFEADSEIDSTHRYYHITPTNPVVMEEILVKAFHEGAVVIIDEFNTLPLEKILNSLMSEGTDPQGQKAKKEGFFVVATQNPISFAGRKALSDPMDKRVHKIELPTYPDHELIEILHKKGLGETKAIDLVDDYNIQRKKASYSHELPTPRDLFNYAGKIIKNANDLKAEDQSAVPANYLTSNSRGTRST
jgi:MoxR-like ATPase